MSPNSEQEIASALANYIAAEVANPPAQSPPAPDFEIIAAGMVDSLGLFKLVAFIEEQFRVTIAPAEILLENFATIDAITRLIRSKHSS